MVQFIINLQPAFSKVLLFSVTVFKTIFHAILNSESLSMSQFSD